MNVFNLISAGGGKSEGLYIWKKYEVTIPAKVLHVDNISQTKKVLTSTDVDVSLLSIADLHNYSGTYTNNPSYADGTVTFGRSGSAEQIRLTPYGTTTAIGFTYTWTPNTGTIEGNSIYNCGVWSDLKTQPTIGDFIDYVISDKEDAYPDKAEKDGFYYEKFTSLDFGDMDITHLSAGEIMIASGTVNLEIVHNLGVNPKFAYIWTDDSTSNAHTIIRCAYVFRSPQYISGCGVWNIGASTSTTSVIQNYTKNSFYAGELTATGTNLYFEAGKKYKFVVLA